MGGDPVDREQPQRSYARILGALALFALALRLACFTGLIGSDDLRYARYARAVMEGNYAETLTESSRYERIHHGLRYGIIIPVAGVYRLFGVSEWSTVMLPLLASTASVLLVALIARKLFDTQVALIAALLYATFPMQLRLASVLLPEPLAECFVLLALLAYVYGRDRGVYMFAAGAFIAAAYLAKETALFVSGALLLHAISERRWRHAILLALGVTAVVAVEHAYYFFGQSDILFRVHSTRIDADSGRAPFRFSARVASLLLLAYPKMMVTPGVNFGLHSLVCLILGAAALAITPWRRYWLLLLWALIPWLYLNFGSSSLSHYALLPREPRYIEFLYPPLIILSAVAFSRAFAARATVRQGAGALLGVVLFTGVASGLATRGHIAKAEEMTMLREIVRAARTQPGEKLYTERRWRGGLLVYDSSLVTSSPESATLIVAPDALDLPAVHRPGNSVRD